MTQWAPEVEAHWQVEWTEVVSGLKEWRLQHPRASFREIETAVDERLARVRARLLETALQASAAADAGRADPAERPVCGTCGGPLVARGRERRELVTTYEQGLTLERSYLVCSRCDEGVFPPR